MHAPILFRFTILLLRKTGLLENCCINFGKNCHKLAEGNMLFIIGLKPDKLAKGP